MTDRKKEIIKLALSCFEEKGLASTSMQDISVAVGMQKSGLYYYFTNKEDLITECVNMAVENLAESLVFSALSYIDDIDHMIQKLLETATKEISMMRFLVSVKVSPEYEKFATGAFQTFSNNYEQFVEMFSKKLNCEKEEVRLYVYILIVSTTNYMIFGESSLFIQQLQPVKDAFAKMKAQILRRI